MPKPPSPGTHPGKYQSYIASLVDSPVRAGNTVDVLTNGDEIFPAMLAAIQRAEQSIAFLTYVYWRGDIAQQFAEALAERAQNGVSVCVLMDAFGSSKVDFKLVRHMQAAGVIVRRFRPLRPHTIRAYNHRTHRKVLVVDSAVGFVGGVGISYQWMGQAQSKRHWRDTHFRIAGPAVADLTESFNDNWHAAGGDRMVTARSAERASGSISLQITPSGPVKGLTQAEKLFLAVIQSAKQSITITTAYFAPSRRFREALLSAAAAGVTVTILTNGPHTNHKVVRLAGHRHYQELLVGGVLIYEYQITVMHAKVLTIDGAWATVGSVNFDDRSFVLNDEVSMSFVDTQLVRALDEQTKRDLKASKEVTLAAWKRRGLVARSVESLANLLRTQL